MARTGLNLQEEQMLKRTVRNLAVAGITIASATVLAALGATGASATVTATPNSGHADVISYTVVLTTPAAANASAAPDSSTTPYTVCSFNPAPPYTGGLGCIADPGHGNVVYVRFNDNTTLNLVYQETTGGFAWYLLRFNGTNDCLNYDPSNGFVYDDSCISDDLNEMWQHHYGNELVNFASDTALTTCNNTGNTRLIASSSEPPGCNFNIASLPQWNWELTEV
jgi:hypothetical protein